MAIESSGAISLGTTAGTDRSISAEFGGDVPHSLSEYYDKGNAPASGEIQMGADFHGTSDAPVGYPTGYEAGGKVKQTNNGIGGDPGADIYVDGDMVVANFTNLTIDSNHGLTTAHPCRGMLIYCSGDLTINGYIMMTGRGPWANPASNADGAGNTVPSTGIRLGYKTATGTSSLAAADFTGCGEAATAAVANQTALVSNGTIWTFEREGAAGAAGVENTSEPLFFGNSGADGGAGETGGGGGGGGFGTASSNYGLGAAGTCFSGGSGGGAISPSGTDSIRNATAYGGPGGYCDAEYDCGSGNPAQDPDHSPSYRPGTDGCGGLMIIIVGGDISGGDHCHCEGTGENMFSGGSGGGNQLILHAGSNDDGGGSVVGGMLSMLGGDGGDGSVRTAAVSDAASGNYFGDGSLGDCQFGENGITQSGHTVDIDEVLSHGSESNYDHIAQWYGPDKRMLAWYGLTVTR